MRRFRLAWCILAAVISLAPSLALAQQSCRNTGNFDRWLADFKRDALGQGISQATMNAASRYLVLDQRIIGRDRGRQFSQTTFLQMVDRRVPSGVVPRAVAKIRQHQPVFAREEKEFGVPPSVITAFWGLETGFGADNGKDPVLKSLATLAYDCRRPDLFRGHLLHALRIIERGDLRPEEMIGAWAGELGQTQFLPTEYDLHAVDYDGDGRRNLIKSAPDVIGSTGKYIQSLGWKRGQPWLQEVRVPQNLKWQEADLAIKHPTSQWSAFGITLASGRPLPSNLQASLVLPMGRLGPAFMAYDNFQVYTTWNNSLIYSLAAAYFANRIDGAPAVHRGAANIPTLSLEQNRELQQILARRGHDVGRTDGVLGLKTRVAIKEEQLKLGLPADSWPTPDLLDRLRGR